MKLILKKDRSIVYDELVSKLCSEGDDYSLTLTLEEFEHLLSQNKDIRLDSDNFLRLKGEKARGYVGFIARER